jgi:hypothetical protein
LQCFTGPLKDVLDPLLFNILSNDFHNVTKFSRFLLFASDTKTFNVITSINDCTQAQTVINCIGLQGWCTTNFMKQNTGKITLITFTTKINHLKNIYKLRDSCTIQANLVKDLGVLIFSKLHFHKHVVYIFSQLIKL